MQRLSARVVVVVVCLSLLVFGVPARTSEDVSIPVSVDGVNGMLTFYFDDAGQIQYINAYAGTADWSMMAFWSAGGGWSFSPVVFNDPDLAGGDSFSPAFAWNGEPSPPPPTDYPIDPSTPTGGKSCQVCVDELREDCRRTWRAESVGAVVVGSTATLGCSVVTATLGFAVCIVGGMAITGTATWIARTHFRQCWNAAPLTCADPVSGKQCSQLGY